MDRQRADVVVIGGGIAGLSVAWRLAQRGLDVVVLDRGEAGMERGAASEAAGGMLAPSAELQFEEVEFYELQRESARRWPDFARELERESDIGVDLRKEGTLMVAVDRDDAEAYRRLYRFQRDQGVPVEWLSTSEALELEPMLSPRIAGAIYAPEDFGVDNRAVLRALREALRRSGCAALVAGAEVTAVEIDERRPTAVLANGSTFEARVIVIATGAWTASLEGLPSPVPIRPVKGQMLSVQAQSGFSLRHVIRTRRGYVVPRSDGRLVVGATAEEMGFDLRVTAGGVYRLLENAVEVLPGVEELPLVETWAGLRPASRDHRPLLGFGFGPGVALATGYFRHGILLAPVAAEELAGEISARLEGEERASTWLAPFSPRRLVTPSSPNLPQRGE